MSRPKPVYLGSLGLMEQFRLPGSAVRYETIGYPPMNTSPYFGCREVLNLRTFKACSWLCNKRVMPIVPHGT